MAWWELNGMSSSPILFPPPPFCNISISHTLNSYTTSSPVGFSVPQDSSRTIADPRYHPITSAGTCTDSKCSTFPSWLKYVSLCLALLTVLASLQRELPTTSGEWTKEIQNWFLVQALSLKPSNHKLSNLYLRGVHISESSATMLSLSAPEFTTYPVRIYCQRSILCALLYSVRISFIAIIPRAKKSSDLPASP